MDEYYKAKTELLCDKMVAKCSQERIADTKKVLLNLSAQRVWNALHAYEKQPANKLAPVAVYELFTQPELLQSPRVLQLVLALVRSHRDGMDELLAQQDRVLPTAIVLATHKDDCARDFAHLQINPSKHHIKPAQYEAAAPWVNTIIRAIRRQQTTTAQTIIFSNRLSVKSKKSCTDPAKLLSAHS